MSVENDIMYAGTLEDTEYSGRLKQLLSGHGIDIRVSCKPITDIHIFAQTYKNAGIKKVLFSSVELLKMLSGEDKPSLENYLGSYFTHSGMEFVCVYPIKRLVTTSYAEFINRRLITKFTKPDNWIKFPKFEWKAVEESDMAAMLEDLSKAEYISIDIETAKTPVEHITHIGYTGIFTDFSMRSYSFRFDSMYKYDIAKQIHSLPAPKIFQNGRYDISYLMQVDLQPVNYIYDTAYLFHSLYAELPKDLGFLGSYYMREGRYWKGLADTNDAYEYMRYNALDSYGTACVMLAHMHEAPDWAINNYLLKFPAVFSAILCENRGIAVDIDMMKKLYDLNNNKSEACVHRLRKRLGEPNFNPASPVQVKNLLKLLGFNEPSGDEKTLKKVMENDSLAENILGDIISSRKYNKLSSTYLDVNKLYKSRQLYSLNPFGTETGRSSSGEHHFWKGVNIQNQPRGKETKQCYIADPGFKMAELDYKMAESFITGYISADKALLEALHGPWDFHSYNASGFFGIPYEEIVADKTKSIRNLGKAVNHGCNYCMGPGVLLQTMGGKNVDKAKKLLKLPESWSRRKVCEYLIECFHKKYPEMRTQYYAGVTKDILTTQKLTGATGWTRYCFGNPAVNKIDLNKYVAHGPQSLNAMNLERALIEITFTIALNPEYSNNIKIIAPIHDSMFFMYREGHDYIKDMCKDIMERPLTITGYDGVTRELVVPVDIKSGGPEGALRWSETE